MAPTNRPPSLYFDENSSNEIIITHLRQAGYDVKTTSEANMLGASDEDQLQYAVAEKRALFSHDVDDFCRIHANWSKGGCKHWGIILVDQDKYPAAEIGHRLEEEFFEARTKEEVTKNLLFL
jgi:hypothetical protein